MSDAVMRSFLFSTKAPRATILIRLLVGAVFLSEGIQKFLFPAALGVGRFTKIGIPAPQFFARATDTEGPADYNTGPHLSSANLHPHTDL